MNKREFDSILKGTRFAATNGNSAAVEAARIHFVEGERNMSECARRAGCTKQAARAAIVRITQLVERQDMISVTVLVPKGAKGKVERFAAGLRANKGGANIT